MAFKRPIHPAELPRGDALTSAMVGIGMNFAATAAHDPNIEDTIYAASVEGMEHDDLRTLSVLVTWLGAHLRWVNVDRLTRLVAKVSSPRIRAFWSSIGRWQKQDRRLARLSKLYRGPRIDLLRVGTDFQVGRHGEDARFARGPLRVPATILRDRAADVLTPPQLARRHRAYRMRILLGPTYRADVWAACDAKPTLSAAELARRTYSSFATAWQVKREFQIMRGAGLAPFRSLSAVTGSTARRV